MVIANFEKQLTEIRQNKAQLVILHFLNNQRLNFEFLKFDLKNLKFCSLPISESNWLKFVKIKPNWSFLNFLNLQTLNFEFFKFELKNLKFWSLPISKSNWLKFVKIKPNWSFYIFWLFKDSILNFWNLSWKISNFGHCQFQKAIDWNFSK